MDNNTQQNPNQVPQTPPAVGNHSNNTGMAILAYLGILIVIPFLTEAHKDPFVKFHIKQGLVLIIAWFAAGIILAIPILGWIVGAVLWIFLVVAFIMGIVNAATGKMKELPLIGKFAHNFHF